MLHQMSFHEMVFLLFCELMFAVSHLHVIHGNKKWLTCCFFIVISYVQQNKQILIDAVVHAVNEDYAEMANDFTRLGFLPSGTDVAPIIPALEAIWQNSAGKGLADFNFWSVTGMLIWLELCRR
jgi:predicted unusual protein kinase regulating ubiquinone biosynthesis (AarF/ABC1/UbiB family)